MQDFIKRKTKMFTSVSKIGSVGILSFFLLVQSILEYGIVIWHPYLAKDHSRLDRVQNRFLCYASYILKQIPTTITNSFDPTQTYLCSHLSVLTPTSSSSHLFSTPRMYLQFYLTLGSVFLLTAITILCAEWRMLVPLIMNLHIFCLMIRIQL